MVLGRDAGGALGGVKEPGHRHNVGTADEGGEGLAKNFGNEKREVDSSSGFDRFGLELVR